MPSSILLSDNGASSGSAGIKSTGGNDGVLLLQTTTSGGTATTAVTLDNNQNMGLGVTPNTWNGGLKAFQNNGAAFVGDGNNYYINSNSYYNSGWKYINSNYATSIQSNGAGAITFNIAPSGTAGNAITFTQAMTLDASGKLGIATTSPIVDLDVGTGSGLKRIWVGPSATGKAQLGHDGTYAYVGTASNQPVLFTVNDAEKARIDTSGYFYVNQTSQLSGYVEQSIITASSSATVALALKAYGSNISLGCTNTDTSTYYAALFCNNGSFAGATKGSITVSNSATAYNTTSDYRLKENVTPMTGALAKVALLKPCTYTWKEDGANGQGFIAHELAEVVPDAVHGAKDAVETYTDEEGNEQTRPVYQGVDTSFLVATLTAAIQEQQAIITQLQADVAALKGAQA